MFFFIKQDLRLFTPVKTNTISCENSHAFAMQTLFIFMGWLFGVFSPAKYFLAI